MKRLSYLLMIFLSASVVALSQMPAENKPDAQLTEDEAKLRIQDWQKKVDDLKAQLNTATTDVDATKAKLEAAKASLKNCQDGIKTLLGVNDADIDQFRQKVGVIEGKIRNYKRMSDDELADKRDEITALENELNELRGNKVSLLPEFFDKIQALARDIRGLYREKKVKSYTVGTWAEDRDCLWNIAGKVEIYGDPFLWPKIWQANTSLVRNPDIIFPGEVLTLPPKGPMAPEELKAERKYFRQKREAAEAKGETPAKKSE